MMTQLIETIQIGSLVKVCELGWDEIETFRIVLPHEANPSSGLLSSGSPVGQALLNKPVGDTIQVEVPIGALHFKIVEIG